MAMIPYPSSTGKLSRWARDTAVARLYPFHIAAVFWQQFEQLARDQRQREELERPKGPEQFLLDPPSACVYCSTGG